MPRKITRDLDLLQLAISECESLELQEILDHLIISVDASVGEKLPTGGSKYQTTIHLVDGSTIEAEGVLLVDDENIEEQKQYQDISARLILENMLIQALDKVHKAWHEEVDSHSLDAVKKPLLN